MCGGTAGYNIMGAVTKVFIYFVLCGIFRSKAISKLDIYTSGDNATVLIGEFQTNGSKALEINFCGSTSRLHFTNVMMYDPMKTPADNRDFNINYTGRITNINVNNGSLSFLLLNVNFTDSGNFTVGKDSCEKVKRRILVTRKRLIGQANEPMILPFSCKTNNTSLIKICKMRASDCITFAMHDVAQNKCTCVVEGYINCTESCVLNEKKLYLSIQRLAWHDKGSYNAWDGTGLLLDSIFLDIKENNITTSPGSTHGHISPSLVSNLTTSLADNYWFLVSAVAVLLALSSLIITAARKRSQRRGKERSKDDLTCPAQGLMMDPVSNIDVQSVYADEREYDELDYNKIELTSYLEPIGIRTDNTE